MLTVKDLGGFVRIVDKGKQDGHTSVQDAALFSRIGKNKNSIRSHILEENRNAKRGALGTNVPR